MTPKPMVYTGPMVLAIMADLKTNSRRIMRMQPPENTVELRKGLLGLWCGFDEKGDEVGFEIYSPTSPATSCMWPRELKLPELVIF